MDREKLTRLQPYTKNYGQLHKTGSWVGAFPQRGLHQLLSIAKWSALNTYVQGTLYEQNRNRLYVEIYVHVIAVSERRGHEFKTKEGGYVERL